MQCFRGQASGIGLSQRSSVCGRHALEVTRVQRCTQRVQQRCRLGGALAAQPKHAVEGDAHQNGEYDPLRDGPLRFLGYSNEVGEAFGMLIPPQLVAASYAVAISYVLVDTVDKFARARSGARDTLTIASSVANSPGTATLQAVATAAAFTQANPGDPPHLTQTDKAWLAGSPHRDPSSAPTIMSSLNGQAASAMASASSSASSNADSSFAGAGLQAVGTHATPAAAPVQQPPAGEAMPFVGAVAGLGGGMWDSGYGGSSSSSNGTGATSKEPNAMERGLDNAAGMIDAMGVVSGTSAGAGSVGSVGGNAGEGVGRKVLTRQEENAALVVGGLKALDTVVWQMLASVMIPGFIIHQSVRLAAQSLSSPAGMKTLNLGASAIGRVLGTDLTSTLPGYVISALPVALGLALVPIICHPIDNVVDKLLDSTLRPVLRKYQMQLQQQQQQRQRQHQRPEAP